MQNINSSGALFHKFLRFYVPRTARTFLHTYMYRTSVNDSKTAKASVFIWNMEYTEQVLVRHLRVSSLEFDEK